MMGKLNYMNQHFLVDENVSRVMAESAEIEHRETCLEIGPGKGAITKYLAESGRKVIGVEIDREMSSYLGPLSGDYPRLRIIYGDFLKTRLPRVDKIVSNVPFNLTEPLFMKLFDLNFKYAVLLLGERFLDSVDRAHMGDVSSRLGLLASCHFDIETLMKVDRSSFTPEPSTNARVVGITPLKRNQLLRDPARYILRDIWKQKGKPTGHCIRTSLAGLAHATLNGDSNFSLEAVLDDLDLPGSILRKREDTLTNQEIGTLYGRLKNGNVRGKLRRSARRFQ